jgi:XTP/dITP diphosphohydrolase
MSSPRRLVLATANPDKAAEIQAILGSVTDGAGRPIELRPRPPEVGEVEETGDTLEDNARLNATALCQATGEAAVADDTGLAVDALGGAPGVWSARFAGEHATYADNVAKLLADLGALHDHGGDRRARFTTVAMVVFPDGREVHALGVVEGRIADAGRGDAGFGYDPVFVPDNGDGRTFAEMTPAEKHGLSHRGAAFRALAVALSAEGSPGGT